MKRAIISVLSILSASITYVSAQKLYEDDLYGSRNKERTNVQNSQKVNSSTKSNTTYKSATAQENNTQKEFIESVDEALLYRMEALSSEKKYPKEYWNIFDMYVDYLSRKYDENLYNVIVLNGKAWVEPTYITSLFDESDPSEGMEEYSKKVKNSLSSNKKSGQTNITINVIDPWSLSVGPYSPWGLSFSWWGARSPFYWGGGYYNPYWGGGYYPPYWGGGYYPPYWGGGHYPPYWGGGNHHNSRPVYYGNTRYGGSPSGGNRNGDYARGSGFSGRTNSVSNNQERMVNTRQNVRVYDASNRTQNSNSRPIYTRPNENRNEIVRENNTFRRTEPTRNTTPERTIQPTRPSYTPPTTTPSRSNGGGFGGGGNNGGGGGGIRRSR